MPFRSRGRRPVQAVHYLFNYARPPVVLRPSSVVSLGLRRSRGPRPSSAAGLRRRFPQVRVASSRYRKCNLSKSRPTTLMCVRTHTRHTPTTHTTHTTHKSTAHTQHTRTRRTTHAHTTHTHNAHAHTAQHTHNTRHTHNTHAHTAQHTHNTRTHHTQAHTLALHEHKRTCTCIRW